MFTTTMCLVMVHTWRFQGTIFCGCITNSHGVWNSKSVFSGF